MWIHMMQIFLGPLFLFEHHVSLIKNYKLGDEGADMAEPQFYLSLVP